MLKDNLSALRNKNGHSQTKMAELLNITRQAYNNYETGIREPDYETLQRLADYFGVTTDYLLGREENEKRPPSKEDERNILMQLVGNDERKMKLIEYAATLDERSLDLFEKLLAAAELTPRE